MSILRKNLAVSALIIIGGGALLGAALIWVEPIRSVGSIAVVLGFFLIAGALVRPMENILDELAELDRRSTR